jgi:hypothetical protein
MPFAAMAYDEHSGPIVTETWGPGTHYVTASVTVADNEVLTIMPGAVVKFAPNTQLLVYGTLNASGTGVETENAIVFTSRDDDLFGEIVAGSDGLPAAGSWHGIYLSGTGDNDGIGELEYCLLRYGGYAGGIVDANVLFLSSDSGYMANCISEYSGQHGVRIQECSPQISQSTFRDNTLSGLYASGSGTPTITDNVFTDNGQYAAYLNQATISPLIAGNTGSGNQINALAFRGSVTADQTWTSTPGFPIVLLSSVTVSDDVRLTITAGTVVKFGGRYQLLVYGTLDANGSQASRVVFTSLTDDYDGDTNGDGDATAPTVGDWHGIYLSGTGDNDGIGELEYCLLRYGGYAGGIVDANVLFLSSDSGHMANCISEYSGQHGVRIQECSPQISQSTFRDNTLSGLYASGSGTPTITDNVFTDNGQYAAYLNQATISPLIAGNTGSGNQINALAFRGSVTADQTWTSTPGFPIVLLSSVTVSDDVRLTITAGTVVKFGGRYQLLVYGTLDANGSQASRVVFTSLTDDYDGDTNGDGDATAPTVGDWHGIYLSGTGDNDGIGELEYCLLRYGGYAGGIVDANVLFLSSDSGHMANCISEYSGQHGVRIQECSPQISQSTFRDNTLSGLYASGSGTPTITDNVFTDNGQYAAYLNQATISPLIAGNTGSGNQINALAFRGSVTADQTWTSTPGFPIVLLSSVTVSDDVRLTITAGTVVKFGGRYQLLVYGTLDANGSQASRVVFTSLTDDYDGDTNGDGDATAPTVGDWHGIYLSGTGNNDGIGELEYCLLRYGGYAGGIVDANVLFLSSDSGHMANCISEYSGQHGVRIQECSPQISNTTLSNNTVYGILVSSGDPRIINSIVWGNTTGGISGAPVVDYSDIQGGYSGEGNMDADPLFFDPSGDYRLDLCSPAIDAGDPVEILTADYNVGELVITVDRVTAISPGDTIWITDGENLESDDVFSAMGDTVTVSNGFLNSYSVANRSYLFTATSDFADEPTPNGRRINMGAYGGGSDAVPSLVCRTDLEGDDFDVDGADLLVFLGALGTSSGDPNFNADADFNNDGTVSMIDLAVLAEEFGRAGCLACP